MTAAYPLTWPHHIPRSKPRETGRFKTTLNGALKNVNDSLRLFASDSGKKLENIVLSSNSTLGVSKPDDPGVAAWFTWDGLQVCIPVDRYTTVEANLQAIHHVLEARRVELRHGTLALVRASFQGLRALPAPARRSCWEVLGLDKPGQMINREIIERAYREKAKATHPDRGGSQEAMAELNHARDEALLSEAAI
ncbi:hypothetical protein SAMN05216548_10742 [Faunimonas pinastri]|uniref:J domain-containing protein n=1 Tax=Faunimonas pinastri TaxID=1855383 RepID=A0A1H9IB40_9HYPH|nr:molecular chaperone DnaJ [Faunimonas pinastri]SEQ71746.1 hypothetical protein SAMN05216548_10742 [Faunimonas pinastri]